MSEALPLSALSKLAFNRAGLHLPGRDPVVADVQYGGPAEPELAISGDPTDRRLILDSGTLDLLLQVARSSLTGRVVIHHAGVRVRQYRAPDGHLYEIVTLVGDAPKPEESAIISAFR